MRKYFILSTLLLIIALPLIVLVAQKRQDVRSRASASTNLYFLPESSTSSPITKKIGESFSLDLEVNPGQNLVSLVKLDISYDPTKVKLSTTNPLSINSLAFPQVLEGPIYSYGRVQVVLSVGSDYSKAISVQTQILTLNFESVAAVNQTLVSFGSGNRILSVATTDNISENVLSNTAPAYLKIIKAKGGSSSSGKGKPR